MMLTTAVTVKKTKPFAFDSHDLKQLISVF